MKKATTSAISKILLLVLSAVMVLSAVACTAKEENKNNDRQVQNEQPQIEEKGQGQTAFSFKVTKKDGTEKEYKINTDKETVGEALAEVGLIAGADSEFGMMVDTVDGEKLDYNTDKMYWAFYIDGEYAMTGADQTKIEAGKVYAFTATAG